MASVPPAYDIPIWAMVIRRLFPFSICLSFLVRRERRINPERADAGGRAVLQVQNLLDAQSLDSRCSAPRRGEESTPASLPAWNTGAGDRLRVCLFPPRPSEARSTLTAIPGILCPLQGWRPLEASPRAGGSRGLPRPFPL